jgi:transcriptional regulator GlxA family with amidase domain
MSPRNFARQFVRQNGTTPHQWLTHQRVRCAGGEEIGWEFGGNVD